MYYEMDAGDGDDNDVRGLMERAITGHAAMLSDILGGVPQPLASKPDQTAIIAKDRWVLEMLMAYHDESFCYRTPPLCQPYLRLIAQSYNIPWHVMAQSTCLVARGAWCRVLITSGEHKMSLSFTATLATIRDVAIIAAKQLP
jgi:hypothetical protein